MGIGTLLGYLIGNRAAILTLAAHPRAWVVGLVFVFSAGFAREYDGEDLLHEPWHLLLPLAASLGSSFFLFCILYGISTFTRKDGPSFFAAYRSFLSLFWLTAPLAWLYAIPYERFLDPLAATNANLATLALVSAWRVTLMVRVAVVLMRMPTAAAIFRVAAYADGVALLALGFLPFRIIDIMGGVRLSEAEAVVHDAATMVRLYGGVLFPVLAGVAFVLALTERKTRWQIPIDLSPITSVSWPLRGLAFASLAVWIGILPFTQPEQWIRRRVEIAFRDGRLGDGLALMSVHTPKDFPPHWEPPPRYLKGEPMSLILDVWDEILRNDPAPWVRQRYMEKLKAYFRTNRWQHSDTDTQKLAHLLNRMPEGEVLVRDMARDPHGNLLFEHLRFHLRKELRWQKKADGD